MRVTIPAAKFALADIEVERSVVGAVVAVAVAVAVELISELGFAVVFAVTVLVVEQYRFDYLVAQLADVRPVSLTLKLKVAARFD